MEESSLLLILTAASIGFIHTLAGPDHYIPFIAMSKAGNWSKSKTIWITTIAGIGHVLSSVILGIIGIALGIAVTSLEIVESFRGELAGWLLITFGLLYFAWGIRYLYKKKEHSHPHFHEDGTFHTHSHNHLEEHAHVHESKKVNSITPWVIFTIFLFGPCEPLIPLLMFPAISHNVLILVLVSLTFGVATIGTMLAVVTGSLYGLKMISFKGAEKYSHAVAGGLILLCGVSIKFLGL
ncbi:MAG TPA: sulfite exporter TauE/SafE family protein [Ignavibacteriaceae bacterium]|nr:sulfite exporter TauE/SafE family protein [Ignavibacteriaceae bacterium]